MSRIPWERPWLRSSPKAFERMVVDFLGQLGKPLMRFEVEHQAVVSGPDGEFTMDARATFKALGADFTVLVECKHHRDHIKREVVQVLADKVASVRAQKGMLFATSQFQRGAIEFARSRQIALVHFTEGGPVFETKSRAGPTGPNRPYDAYWVSLSDTDGVSYRFGAHEGLGHTLFGGAPA